MCESGCGCAWMDGCLYAVSTYLQSILSVHQERSRVPSAINAVGVQYSKLRTTTFTSSALSVKVSYLLFPSPLSLFRGRNKCVNAVPSRIKKAAILLSWFWSLVFSSLSPLSRKMNLALIHWKKLTWSSSFVLSSDRVRRTLHVFWVQSCVAMTVCRGVFVKGQMG